MCHGSNGRRAALRAAGNWQQGGRRGSGAAGAVSRRPGLVRALPKAGWALATPLTPGEAWEHSSTDGLDGHVGFLMETCVGSCQVPGFFFSLVFAQIFSKQLL